MKNQRNDDVYAETQVLDSAHEKTYGANGDADAAALYDEYVRELEAEPKQRKSVKQGQR